MAFPSPHHLSKAQLAELLATFKPDETVSVVRIRYRNAEEVRRSEDVSVEHLRKFIFECIENEDQPGGDLEVAIPALNGTLIGHHDGVYWLEPRAGQE